MNDNVLSIHDLRVAIDDKTILHKVNCVIEKNKITVIIGRSGAGKSTLLKSIIGLVQASGEVIWNGVSIAKSESIYHVRKNLAYVGQIPVVFEGSVRDNILFARSYWGMDTDDDIAKHYCQMVNLDLAMLDTDANALSVGQKQRVHLARTLALDPEVLLLDEPSSNLDVIATKTFEEMILALRNNNPDISIVMVSHDLMQARRIADRIVLMDNGKMILEEDADEFFNKTFLSSNLLEDAKALEVLLDKLGGVH